MSNCIKDLCDYELIKKCSKCGIVSLKSNFHKNKKSKDGLHPQCIFCRKVYYNESRDRVKQYYLDNHDRIKEYYLENREQINT